MLRRARRLHRTRSRAACAPPVRGAAATHVTSSRRSADAPGPLIAASPAANDGPGGETEHGVVIYDRPALYDVAFSLRDFEAQTDFMLRAAEAHGGAAPRSFLELACGPGRHARAAARRGLRATGLDRSAAMLAYAREQQAADGGGAATFVEGDMTRLRKGGLEKHDVIACLLGSFTHLLTWQAALKCLRGCARLLSRRGVVVLELPPPRRLFDGSAAHAARPARGLDAEGAEDAGFEVPSWDVGDEARGLHVAVQWGAPGDAFCPLTQVLRRTVTITAWRDDNAARDTAGVVAASSNGNDDDADDDMDAFLSRPPSAEVVECVPSRFYTLPELELLARAAGLRVAALHGDLDASAAADSPEAHALVVVLAHPTDDDDA